MPLPGGYTYYVSAAEVRLIITGTENNPGTAAGLSDADINEAIDEAQQEVDGRLADRYTTPFITPPKLVASITRDIAAYLATFTYRRGNPIQSTEPVALRYGRAQGLLAQIAAGALPLQVPNSTPGDDEAASGSQVSNPWDGDLWEPVDFRLTTSPSGFPMWPRGF